MWYYTALFELIIYQRRVMTKKDIISTMAVGADITNAKATAAFNAMIDGIRQALSDGERVLLGGLGTFTVTDRRERQVRHPADGRPVTVKGGKSVRFKAGVELSAELSET